MNIFEKDQAYIENTYSRFPINLVSGKGSLVYDEQGKEYIDFGSGIAVNTLGIADEKWIAAVSAQLNKLSHSSNLYYTSPCANLAEMLCKKTGMKKVFFSNSGAESNECAIKCARKYAAEKKGVQYSTIVTLKNSFHGRTITTLSATGQDSFHQDFTPLTPGFVYAQAGNIQSVIKLCEENKVAAIMFELVQGEGGVNKLDETFVREMAEYAKANDILLIDDEVQIGNGRSGALYAYMLFNITPDIVSTAKGLGGGLPIGATLFGEKTAGVLTAGTHGSTFGGNPASCAGGLSILSRLDDKLLSEVREKSELLFSELTGAPGIESVSGMGLMLGVKTKADAAKVISLCIKRGLLVLKAKDKIRMLPALNIPNDLLIKGVKILKQAAVDALE